MEAGKKEITLCFTGTRPKNLCGYEKQSYTRFVKELMDYLKSEFYDNGFRTFISGGAQGFDQLAFWAGYHLKQQENLSDLQNVVYVPFAGQEKVWAEKGSFSQAEYKAMLKVADEVKILRPGISRISCSVSEALLNRNHRMVADSSLLVALFPEGEDFHTKMRSGTAECMRYAEKQKLTIVRIGYTVKDKILIPEFFGNEKEKDL